MFISYANIFFVSILYVFSIPVFEWYIGSIGNILINGLILLLYLIIILGIKDQTLKNIFNDHNLSKISLLLFFYLLIIIISLFIGLFDISTNPILRDLYELHKPILYLLIILLIYNVLIKSTNDLKLEKYLLTIFIIISIISLFQIMHFKQIVLWYTALNIYESNRLTIPFGNPYDHAFVMLFFCIFFFFKYISGNYKYIFLFILSFYFFLESGSRSVSLSFILSFALLIPIIFLFSKYDFKKKIFYVFQIIIITIFSIYFYDFSDLLYEYRYVFKQFTQFLNQGDIGASGEWRIQQFLFVWERAISNPFLLIFGNGPGKALSFEIIGQELTYYLEHLESAPTYLLYRYGIIGVIIFTLIFYNLFKITFNNHMQLSKDNNLYLFNMTAMTFFLSIPICFVGGMYIEQPRVSFFFYMIVAFVLVVNKTISQKKISN